MLLRAGHESTEFDAALSVNLNVLSWASGKALDSFELGAKYR